MLHRGDLDKMVGTHARYPVNKLSVFEMTYGVNKGEGASDLRLLLTVDALSYYARKIIPATVSDDYCYITTPFSIYLLRLEKNRLVEIQTSSAAKAIADNFNTDSSKQLFILTNKTERSVLNYNTTELKLDGACRSVALPGDRLLICTDKGEFVLMHVRFDQADLDVAEASFVKLQADDKCVPSSLSWVPLSHEQNLNIMVFTSSHYQDSCLFKLSQISDLSTAVETNEQVSD